MGPDFKALHGSKGGFQLASGSCNYGFRQVSLPGCVFGKGAQAALANQWETGNCGHCLELTMVNCVGGRASRGAHYEV